MNKLDVALKLLQLLNERTSIDSRVVANELNVSLRTAQRYLVELSILPCVISKHNHHTYCLNPEYQLSGSLKPPADSGPAKRDPEFSRAFKKYSLSSTVCLLCGGRTVGAETRNHTSSLAVHENASNVARIDRLAALISRRLKNGKCSFP